jgi:hypothetical protein
MPDPLIVFDTHEAYPIHGHGCQLDSKCYLVMEPCLNMRALGKMTEHQNVKPGEGLKPENLMIEEFKALRSEIIMYIKDIRYLEIFTLTATGAVWAFFLAQVKDQEPLAKKAYLGLWIPFVLACLVFIMRMMLHKRLLTLGKYIRILETIFYHNIEAPDVEKGKPEEGNRAECKPDGGKRMGWETRLAGIWKEERSLDAAPIGIFWCAIFVCTFGLPFLIIRILG